MQQVSPGKIGVSQIGVSQIGIRQIGIIRQQVQVVDY
jgi:hypothetical protein